MKELRISDDRVKLLLYTIINLVITITLMILAAILYSIGAMLFAFLAITAIWFSVKAMCRYGKKWLQHTPVIEFTKEKVILYSLPSQPQLSYADIKEVKLMRDQKSLKLFFSSDKVEHPSGWYYAGVIYLFQRSLLDALEQDSIACLQAHKVPVRKVEKM